LLLMVSSLEASALLPPAPGRPGVEAVSASELTSSPEDNAKKALRSIALILRGPAA
jgi:hypothetical protein